MNRDTWLARRPVCWACRNPIEGDECYEIGAKHFCFDCEEEAIEELWSRVKDDYIYEIPEE